MDDDPRYELALEEARRGIDQQNADLASLRSRAVSTLGFGGLAASFIGGLAASHDVAMSGAAWVGVAGFVFALGASLMALRPAKLEFVQSPSVIVGWADEHDAELPQMQQHLAKDLEVQYDRNRVKLDALMRWYMAGAVALGVQVLALVVYLTGS